ncbi:motility associated factor glycosyltransferase family protein, partial [Campylobacter jejuni]|nr:motility associated factor glycosyltransferase family protein [Campylobacter jejuni]ECZ3435428.1 motility associated factor glycosyltransferase family protein [Campylobacter jejuni]EDA0771833.1 motility associated factor glycosyltransferase family protein [Campylobacter jejuni]EGC6742659.1 motility associated factor glycosyltransferase family protein [Campylobacter jejuni]EIU0805658.1 motility associated factor glycosyltransferase family protein [Campylobacter jejuni]
LNFFYQSILEKTPRYPFICIYGIGNALLIKNLAKHYKHLFVFESEIELFILALSVLDLSEELKVYKVVLFDCVAKDLEIQIAMIFDQQSILEYLSLYEMFISSHYYLKYYEVSILFVNELCIKSAAVAIRNADITCFLPLLTHGQFLQNIPSMLESIPFQRILSERKNKFENAIVVSAGPSLAKQLPLLKAYQDKAVIFCADGALSMLEKEGIIPDYVTNLDFTDLAMKFFQNKENLKQSIIALECATHPNVARSLKAENCMIILRNKALYQRFNLSDFGYIDTGTHVSHFSYTLALALGFKNIIMIGQDLAFDEKGNSHSQGFSYGEQFSGEKTVPTLKTQAYAGKGEVLTHITWNDYRIKLEYLFACNSKEAKFYNATEGGARINFTEELSFKECCEKLLTKFKPKFELPKSLTKNRSDKLLVKFKEKIQKDQENAKRFLNDALALKQILENILSKDFILPLEFLEKVYQNIENFNHSLDEDEFIQDETLRGAFAYRGKLISDVLKLHIQDKTHFITAYIKAYHEWLLYFMEKLEQKYKSLSKV